MCVEEAEEGFKGVQTQCKPLSTSRSRILAGHAGRGHSFQRMLKEAHTVSAELSLDGPPVVCMQSASLSRSGSRWSQQRPGTAVISRPGALSLTSLCDWYNRATLRPRRERLVADNNQGLALELDLEVRLELKVPPDVLISNCLAQKARRPSRRLLG